MATRLTSEELLAALKRSSLNTILVEGDQDMMLYRYIEERVALPNTDVLPCGGRTVLLDIFEKRAEVQNIRIAFVADQDSYLYTGIPPGHEDIIWTRGYSIENDLYEGRALEQLLGGAEQGRFLVSLENFIQYYSTQYDLLMSSNACELTTHPSNVLEKTDELRAPFASLVGTTPPRPESVEFFRTGYELRIRGKSLFGLLVRLVSHPGRSARHGYDVLYETAAKITNPDSVTRIVNACRAKLE